MKELVCFTELREINVRCLLNLRRVEKPSYESLECSQKVKATKTAEMDVMVKVL